MNWRPCCCNGRWRIRRFHGFSRRSSRREPSPRAAPRIELHSGGPAANVSQGARRTLNPQRDAVYSPTPQRPLTEAHPELYHTSVLGAACSNASADVLAQPQQHAARPRPFSASSHLFKKQKLDTPCVRHRRTSARATSNPLQTPTAFIARPGEGQRQPRINPAPDNIPL